MKKYFTLILCFAAFVTTAQSVTKEHITGMWKGVALQATGKMAKEELKELQAMFANSTFTFFADGNCTISLPGGNREMKTMLAKNQWLFEANKARIKIGTKADKFSMMGITVKVIDGKTYFELLESGSQLEVIKI